MEEKMYTIPKEIKGKIPYQFFVAMIGELTSIYGEDLFEYENDEYTFSEFVTEDAMFFLAFKESCYKLNLHWLNDYFNTIENKDLNYFAKDLAKTIENFWQLERYKSVNSYAKYLNEKFKDIKY